MTKTVIGLFDNFAQAQKVVQDLVNSGFTRDDISLVRTNPDTGKVTNTTAAGDNVASDAGVGAVLGGIAGLLVGLGALAIPGVGPIIAAGPIAAALGGAGIGAATGGLIGALVGIGVPEEQAHYYQEGVRRGGTLVSVKSPDNLVNQAVQIMNQNGAIDINRRAGEWKQGGWTGAATAPATTNTMNQTNAPSTAGTMNQTTTPSTAGAMSQTTTPATAQTTTTSTQPGEMRIPVVEEQVNVQKQPVVTGGVQVTTNVEEQPVEQNVTLRNEDVNVERRPVDRPATEADLAAFKEGTFEVTERSEQPVVSKTARVVEEVVVNKDVTQETVPVRDTVRRTDVNVEQIPAATTSTTTNTQPSTTYDTNYRNHFNTNFASSGATYDTYRPAYEYGTRMASQPQYRSGDWNTYESQFRRDWEQNNPNTPWDNVKDAVQYSWDDARRSV